MTDATSRNGKQIFFNGRHIADAVSESDADTIVDALVPSYSSLPQASDNAIERVARCIAPQTWKNKDDGGEGYQIDMGVRNSLNIATDVLKSSGDILCLECGQSNPVWWSPNELWNAVMGDDGGVLCPNCFLKRVLLALRSQPASGDAGLIKELTDFADSYSEPDEAAALIRKAANVLRSQPASGDDGDLQQKLRMVISHATGGKYTGEGMSTNAVCVAITERVNVVYEGGRKHATAEAATLASADDGAKKPSADVVFEMVCEALGIHSKNAGSHHAKQIIANALIYDKPKPEQEAG